MWPESWTQSTKILPPPLPLLTKHNTIFSEFFTSTLHTSSFDLAQTKMAPFRRSFLYLEMLKTLVMYWCAGMLSQNQAADLYRPFTSIFVPQEVNKTSFSLLPEHTRYCLHTGLHVAASWGSSCFNADVCFPCCTLDYLCKAQLHVSKRIVIKSEPAREKPLLSKVSIKNIVQSLTQKANAVMPHLSQAKYQGKSINMEKTANV